jgi:hypothetical protein
VREYTFGILSDEDRRLKNCSRSEQTERPLVGHYLIILGSNLEEI